jgi:16S rRNA (guanine527-N7)-methyltransferase
MSVEQELKVKLESGLAQAKIELTSIQVDHLIAYLLLMIKWNKVFNVTAIRDPMAMVTLHIMDSLSVLAYVKNQNAKTLLDVGAGAGLPSIPLAICLPELQVHAVDSVQKKETFMRQVKGELGLNNFVVETGRVEKLNKAKFDDGQGFDLIISRAFSEVALFFKLTKHLLKADGLWLAMKGVNPVLELEKVTIVPSEVIKLTVPTLDAERHLVVFNNNL